MQKRKSKKQPSSQPTDFLLANARKIRDLRQRLNLSQERFGKKIGISGKTVSAYENGKCIPPLRILERMSDSYDASFTTIKSVKKDELAKKIDYIKNVISELEKNILN